MKHDFWSQRWAAAQIGFHLPEVNPRLQAHVGRLGNPERVLVPLCGKTLDMAFLAAQGFAVEGVEFVEAAATAFFDEAGVVPQREVVQGQVCFRHEAIRIWVADVLALPGDLFSPVSAIFDRAALVALDPGTRQVYVAQLARLSAPKAAMLLVTFEHDSGEGPPFSVEAAQVKEIFDGQFDLTLIERIDVQQDFPKFRERGMTRIHEGVWAGHRVGPAAS